MQQDILWADHLVFVYPNWWSTVPALLKGLIDRMFVPGFAFKYRENSPFWDKLLKGKTAEKKKFVFVKLFFRTYSR